MAVAPTQPEPMATTSVVLARSQRETLTRMARARFTSVSALVREALVAYLASLPSAPDKQ